MSQWEACSSAESAIDPILKRTLRKIDEIQEPILKDLSQSITKTISSFLPSVKAVEIKMLRDARIRAMRRSLQIEVDDGNNTPLVLLSHKAAFLRFERRHRVVLC